MNGFSLELHAMVALRERELEREQIMRESRWLAALTEVVTRAPLAARTLLPIPYTSGRRPRFPRSVPPAAEAAA